MSKENTHPEPNTDATPSGEVIGCSDLLAQFSNIPQAVMELRGFYVYVVTKITPYKMKPVGGRNTKPTH